jgi:hypothetical protein
VATPDRLHEGRTSFAQHAWADTHEQLTAVDREMPLEPEDLERLAMAAYLIGRDDESCEILARAHHEFLSRKDTERAIRCTFWLAPRRPRTRTHMTSSSAYIELPTSAPGGFDPFARCGSPPPLHSLALDRPNDRWRYW